MSLCERFGNAGRSATLPGTGLRGHLRSWTESRGYNRRMQDRGVLWALPNFGTAISAEPRMIS